ncbi:MAG: hypothetical protein R3F18_20710 [Lysobacterales bacterium]
MHHAERHLHADLPGRQRAAPVESVPVPAINEQGRILLAALVLLLGLGVIGFRMRG